jgi:FMN reductase
MSSPVPVTLVVGNPRRASRTLGVAAHAAKLICAGLRDRGTDVAEPDLVDLAELGPRLPMRVVFGSTDPALEHALGLVRRPGLLIVASPTFKGAYTGLVKLFFDLLPQQALSVRTVAVALMTAGWEQHRHVADTYLRTLLVELGATVPVPGLAVLESEFGDVSGVVAGWAGRSIPVLASLLNACLAGPLPDGAADFPDPVPVAASAAAVPQ